MYCTILCSPSPGTCTQEDGGAAWVRRQRNCRLTIASSTTPHGHAPTPHPSAHLVPREDDLDAAPQGVLLQLAAHEVLHVRGHGGHELGAGRDAVGVEHVRLRDVLPRGACRAPRLRKVACGAEAAGALREEGGGPGRTDVGGGKPWHAGLRSASQRALPSALSRTCWFILARGATPSMAMYSSARGLMILTILSMYANMLSIMSCAAHGGRGGERAPHAARRRRAGTAELPERVRVRAPSP